MGLAGDFSCEREDGGDPCWIDSSPKKEKIWGMLLWSLGVQSDLLSMIIQYTYCTTVLVARLTLASYY